MRMSVTLDDELLEEVMSAFGVTVKREAIEIALKEALRSKRRTEALRHRGGIELDIDLKGLERLRAES